MKQAQFIYNTFVISKWRYASFLQPFNRTVRQRLDGLDAGFISVTLLACRTRGTGNRHSSLPTLRALARLPSPQHRRKADAHAYVARLIRIVHDEVSPQETKSRARAALSVIPQLPTFQELVPDAEHPWTPAQARKKMEEEWRRASQTSSRPVPPPSPGPCYSPPALRLKDAWAVALAARYHCSTFPIFHRPVPREGPRNLRGRRPRPMYEKAQRSHDENAALATLVLLHSSTCSVQELAAITEALRVLRPREKWAHQPGSA